MPPINLLSASGQVAEHIRGQLAHGQWTGTMPGVNMLAANLGVNRKTVDAALRQLEREGLIAGQGPGRKRLIVQSGKSAVARPLRVATLLYERTDRHSAATVELQHELVEAGHALIAPAQSLSELGMNVDRVSRLVRQTKADAWVISAGSREVLEWFCAQKIPAFALFGRREGLPIAAVGPNKLPAYTDLTRRLISLGHRRIVMLSRRERRLPQPGKGEQLFLDELKAHGISTNAFNLPEWEETREGFHELLSKVFRVTPPTALIADEAPLFFAAQLFLAGRGLRVPHDVSLICTDPDPVFDWCTPSIAHIRWDSEKLVRRILRWAATVSCGRRDVRQSLVPAEFISGGTIARAHDHVLAHV